MYHYRVEWALLKVLMSSRSALGRGYLLSAELGGRLVMPVALVTLELQWVQKESRNCL